MTAEMETHCVSVGLILLAVRVIRCFAIIFSWPRT